MLPAHIEEALVEVELHFNDVSAALISGEPLALAAASTALRQASIDFSVLLQRLSPLDLQNGDFKLRLKKIAIGMASQRESLIRRSALVEMALNAIVPATQSTTYARATGPYGSAGKQSGAFKYLSA
jgi:hypothetical protein